MNKKSNSSFCTKAMFVTILITTAIISSSLILTQHHTAMAQQQLTFQTRQQPFVSKDTSFDIDNVTFSHHMAAVNSIQMHYVIGGHGDPVFLLHGWPETW